jgi:adenosylhomocysteine nucleosidase
VTDTKRILVLAPMTSELKPLLKPTGARSTERDGVRYHEGHVGDTEVVMLQVGVGPQVARTNTARALGEFQPDHVFVSGIAGGLAPEAAVGSVVIPVSVLDLATGQTFQPTVPAGLTAAGTVAVADYLITDQKLLRDLTEQGITALEMESSGVAMACDEAGIPWTTVRVIGDRPDEGLTDDAVMSFLRPDGTADAPAAIRYLLAHPRRIPGMVRLGRDSAKAASKAAKVTLGAIEWKG